MSTTSLSRRLRAASLCLHHWASVASMSFAAIFSVFTCSAVHAQPNHNLAYDDGFVWYVARRLAGEQIAYPEWSGVKLSEGQWADQRQQFEIVYRHYLVRCDGPLPKLADILKFVDVAWISTQSATGLLAEVGALEDKIWPEILVWRAKVIPSVMATYSTGKYGFYPECVVSGYLEQNPLPK